MKELVKIYYESSEPGLFVTIKSPNLLKKESVMLEFDGQKYSCNFILEEGKSYYYELFVNGKIVDPLNEDGTFNNYFTVKKSSKINSWRYPQGFAFNYCVFNDGEKLMPILIRSCNFKLDCYCSPESLKREVIKYLTVLEGSSPKRFNHSELIVYSLRTPVYENMSDIINSFLLHYKCPSINGNKKTLLVFPDDLPASLRESISDKILAFPNMLCLFRRETIKVKRSDSSEIKIGLCCEECSQLKCESLKDVDLLFTSVNGNTSIFDAGDIAQSTNAKVLVRLGNLVRLSLKRTFKVCVAGEEKLVINCSNRSEDMITL